MMWFLLVTCGSFSYSTPFETVYDCVYEGRELGLSDDCDVKCHKEDYEDVE